MILPVTDPVGRIGAELVALGVIILFYSLHQTHVAFLNQVDQRKPSADIFLSNADNETEIAADEALPRVLILILRVEHRQTQLFFD